MPTQVSYPGVYIEEVPSGVRTITGVATSITAFLGRAPRGPVDDPIPINSFGNFERIFGGLSSEHMMSYAVRDFFLNGGSRALVVRLFNGGEDDVSGISIVNAGGLEIEAASPGAWGNNLQASIDTANITDEVAELFNLDKADLFNLTVRDVVGGVEQHREQFKNVAIKNEAGPRRIDRVLMNESQLARIRELSTEVPSVTTFADPDWSWGEDFESVAKEELEKLKNEDPPSTPAIEKAEKVLEAAEKITPAEKKFKAAGNKVKIAEEDLVKKKKAEAEASQAEAAAATAAVTAAENALKTAENTLKGEKKTLMEARIALGNAKKMSIVVTQGDNGSALSTANDYGEESKKTGLFALLKTDIFNLLCIPPDSRGGDTLPQVYQKALAFCAKQRAMLIVDPLSTWNEPNDITPQELGSLNLAGLDSRNAALYFPRVVQPDPKLNGQVDTFVPCGIVAGIMARTDATRGVWKAPAGLDATITGIRRLAANINDQENGTLNPLGVNCLRNFDLNGKVIWGARTMRGADQLADEYKYIPVRRLALFMEESLYRGTQWVIFEPNDEPLWAQIRLNVGAFMNNLFRQGAFQGQTPKEAYFVKCDKETTTQNDINLGIVNVVVGFAPLKPAEFLVIKITQIIGDIQT